jgi:hypothetical protein
MRNWLETGDDSPYRTWQRAGDEVEMRNLIADHLKRSAAGRYTCAQENELANAQRPDIWIQSATVPDPVPIELKVLDKGWSGTALCERLRNQLVGDYLRHGECRSGVFLLVWQGQAQTKRWNIDGKLVGLAKLEKALTRYWQAIARDYSQVEGIEVVVVDLMLRKSPAKQG